MEEAAVDVLPAQRIELEQDLGLETGCVPAHLQLEGHFVQAELEAGRVFDRQAAGEGQLGGDERDGLGVEEPERQVQEVDAQVDERPATAQSRVEEPGLLPARAVDVVEGGSQPPDRPWLSLARWAGSGVGVCEWVYWRERTRFERMIDQLRALGVRRVRTGLGWADWDRPGAEEWFDHVMERLAEFELTLTLCFTPARAGRTPHHTSPPVHLGDFAGFCESVLRRYRRHWAGTALAATCTPL